MLGSYRPNRADLPELPFGTEGVPRRAQLAKLDRHASLTVIRAPRGYGKTTLIASWLRTVPVTERVFVWIAEPDPHMTARQYFNRVRRHLHEAGIDLRTPVAEPDHDPVADIIGALSTVVRPVALVLIRPDKIDARVDDQLVDIVNRCPKLSIIVTLTGRTSFPEPHLLDVEQESVTATDLLHSLDDTKNVITGAGAKLHSGEAECIHSTVGGLPVLVRRAVSVVKNLPATAGRKPVLEHNLRQMLEHYTNEFVLREAKLFGQYDFAFATSIAQTLTVELAGHLYESSDSVEQTRERLLALEASGILLHLPTETQETWAFAAPIRVSLLALQTRTGLDLPQRLTDLAYYLLEAGNRTSALDYAVEAQNWDLAAQIIEQHWVSLIVDDLASVRSAYQQIPAAVADRNPAVQAGRNLFTRYQADHMSMDSTLPESITELRSLGASPGAGIALINGCVQALMQIHFGEYDRAAQTTGRLIVLSQSVLEHDSESISAQLPLMRMQWAVTYQLTGRFTDSSAKAREAYWGSISHGLDFAARNAAGIVAMNWAIVGEPTQARYWSDLENKHLGAKTNLEPVVKVAGLTARVLTSVDVLDLDAAERALAELGHPTASEELWVGESWAFVVYAHSQFALARNKAFAALSLLHRTIAAHTAQCNPTSFALPLMRSAEIDLLIALGEGNRAEALAATVDTPSANPWTLVSVARLRQRSGNNDSAIALCHQFDWAGEPYPRAHMESLLIQAVAYAELGDESRASDAWSKACAIADQTGLLRPFSTIAYTDIDRLESAAPTHSCALADFMETSALEIFPRSVHIVSLTDREQLVLTFLSRNMGSAAIAVELYVSANTVKSQLRTLYKKLDVHNRDEAIAKAHSLGFI
ncbi:LuxR family maltose regulon positive regulatory protein [Rhodococcus sp. 27YEA15]|uniref:LuxR C-terminal-related transcriptional regulator n=1 Tax=Rhodococcus sp. 27YEA15 TaxID=3156259 RepID=UPI003C7E6A23